MAYLGCLPTIRKMIVVKMVGCFFPVENRKYQNHFWLSIAILT